MYSFGGLIGKQRPSPVCRIAGTFAIRNADNDQRLAFGRANVAVTPEGDQLEDLEKAAYEFAELYREGGELHNRRGCAVLVESTMFTKEKQRTLGIPAGALPEGQGIGFHVTDDDVRVKTIAKITAEQRKSTDNWRGFCCLRSL